MMRHEPAVTAARQRHPRSSVQMISTGFVSETVALSTACVASLLIVTQAEIAQSSLSQQASPSPDPPKLKEGKPTPPAEPAGAGKAPPAASTADAKNTSAAETKADKIEMKAYKEELKGTTVSFEMLPFKPKDGGKPFYVAKTETTWDLYDVFLFGFDEESPDNTTPEAEAVSRPSKPYISMDRGFGHAGFPAISISYYGAKKYCEWLSAKTGKPYRLPTVAEWKALCANGGLTKETAKEHAWFQDNADAKTHAVASSKADANGLFDLWGNASEWCLADTGKGVTMGGTFKDGIDALGCESLVPWSADWNASDPQFPKSKWWLADGGFVGFRLVCDVP
jgi:formylglycine-generating enzyme required for sulfatase activity